jgi:Na+/melibiose symporter-like transporter
MPSVRRLLSECDTMPDTLPDSAHPRRSFLESVRAQLFRRFHYPPWRKILAFWAVLLAAVVLRSVLAIRNGHDPFFQYIDLGVALLAMFVVAVFIVLDKKTERLEQSSNPEADCTLHAKRTQDIHHTP